MTRRVCVVEQRDDHGKPIGRCIRDHGVEHDEHVNAFGETFENHVPTNAEWIRSSPRHREYAIEPFEMIPDGSPVPGAAVRVVTRLERLGLQVDVLRARVGVDALLAAEDGKTLNKGDVRTPAHERLDYIVVGHEKPGEEQMRVLACWEYAQREKQSPAFAYADVYAPPTRLRFEKATAFTEWLTGEESLR